MFRGFNGWRPVRVTAGRCVLAAVDCLLIFGFAGCGKVDIAWTEDVDLQDGTHLVVARSAGGKKQGEIGGPGGWESTQMILEIKSPVSAANPPIWSERWVPILMDYDAQTKEWFVVATFYMCTDWYDLGRPKLPYVEYRVKDGRWQQVPLSAELFGRKANLLTGPRAGGEPEHVSIGAKALRNARAGDKYKTIVSHWSTAC